MTRFATLAAIAACAAASYSGNLNYLSPSKRHADLGIDIPKLHKRSLDSTTSSWGLSALTFTHGVASGDPYADSLILWTRVAPGMESDRSNVAVSGYAPMYNHDTEEYVKASAYPICVEYEVSQSKDMRPVVDRGRAYTSSDIDYTVKVEAKQLQSWTTYYYQFAICNSEKKSPIGKAKTLPRPDERLHSINIGVFSCSNYPNGYFNPYGTAARNNRLDLLVHLGDYIYEYRQGVLGRDPRATDPPKELFSLYDYRQRIGQYRTDPDLLLLHQSTAWITTWDDHEVANNGYRDGFSRMDNIEDSFVKAGGVSVDQRKMNAVRAYFEWMPIRQVDMDDNLRIWRNFAGGDLFDLIMLDTRNYDRSITTLDGNDDYIHAISNDAGRSLMGSAQENWFYKQLSNSSERGATWRIIGDQIIFSRVNISSSFGTLENPYNGDQWDGYQANRNRTLHHLYSNNIGNNVFLAGDSHANWVSDIVWLDEKPYDQASGEGAIGVEFAVTAISSTGYGSSIGESTRQASTLIRDNPELWWTEGYYRGYVELQISHEKVNAKFWGSLSVATRNPYELSLANFTVQAGVNHLERPVGGGRVESGVLRGGEAVSTNFSKDTATGEWSVQNDFTKMYITYTSAA
ncbi:hypothetical protein P152DRAFT_161214 [Eremomyces bilateralis CBS 781.70]|uniref:Alkaline phosphatase n=1 Tax=Eremomyces bilateralis CBS 781.70 TaxID=1392243 RepID=A0A6G1FUG1_9PEZI|nr:uncharacterized protein P152DRAFT_161214 [Eremomyces bilateralis CBS 781.70]KAF1809346.1 hypothetical protein P152DRAFT_161214 [Eremomyces bilateralis CBS 781.70]